MRSVYGQLSVELPEKIRQWYERSLLAVDQKHTTQTVVLPGQSALFATTGQTATTPPQNRATIATPSVSSLAVHPATSVASMATPVIATSARSEPTVAVSGKPPMSSPTLPHPPQPRSVPVQSANAAAAVIVPLSSTPAPSLVSAGKGVVASHDWTAVTQKSKLRPITSIVTTHPQAAKTVLKKVQTDFKNSTALSVCHAGMYCKNVDCDRVHGAFEPLQHKVFTRLKNKKAGVICCVFHIHGQCAHYNDAKCTFRHFTHLRPLSTEQKHQIKEALLSASGTRKNANMIPKIVPWGEDLPVGDDGDDGGEDDSDAAECDSAGVVAKAGGRWINAANLGEAEDDGDDKDVIEGNGSSGGAAYGDDGGQTLSVGNLKPTTTKNDVFDLFKRFGSCDVHLKTGAQFAFVTVRPTKRVRPSTTAVCSHAHLSCFFTSLMQFEDPFDAKEAFEYLKSYSDTATILGQIINVEWVKAKQTAVSSKDEDADDKHNDESDGREGSVGSEGGVKSESAPSNVHIVRKEPPAKPNIVSNSQSNAAAQSSTLMRGAIQFLLQYILAVPKHTILLSTVREYLLTLFSRRISRLTSMRACVVYVTSWSSTGWDRCTLLHLVCWKPF